MLSKQEPASLTLTDFSMRTARHQIEQGQSLAWLARAHAAAETTLRQLDAAGTRAFEERISKVLQRCACGPKTISRRGHDYFAAEYAAASVPPGDVIHVICTGYTSPSGAQKLVADKGWGAQTRVTHAYQMGCCAAFPALRIAAGFLQCVRAVRRHRAHGAVLVAHGSAASGGAPQAGDAARGGWQTGWCSCRLPPPGRRDGR